MAARLQTHRWSARSAAPILLAAATSHAHADGTDANPLLTVEGMTAHEVLAKPTRHAGRDGSHVTVAPDHKSIEQGGCDNCTLLMVDGIDFGNGTIEIDVAGAPTSGAPDWARGFGGVVVRADAAATTYEGVYLRPLNAVAGDQLGRNHTLQYFSYPDFPWHALRKSDPGAYESYAPLEPGAGTHLRLEVEGDRAELYVNHADEPALVVGDLKHGPDLRGTIGLFTEPATDAYFRNLIVTHQ